ENEAQQMTSLAVFGCLFAPTLKRVVALAKHSVRRCPEECARPCPHGKVQNNCKLCQACPHGKLRDCCSKCSGCKHEKLIRDCRICSSCVHGKLKRTDPRSLADRHEETPARCHFAK
ncbi:unnamed protein product, partial [Effrenium voratum]